MKKNLLLLFMLCAAGELSVNAQTILGVDVSHYDGTITWSQVKTAGKLFSWAKATESTTITDATFVANMTNGESAGVAMGAYHFAHPETNSATSEANYFLSVAGSYIVACQLPPALDLEDPPSGPALTSAMTSAALTTWVQTWMTTVQNATGITPVLYTDGSIATYLGSSIKSVYPLWMADPDGSSSTPPASLGGWPTWAFKQYSWTGTVSGISSQVDMNVFNGNTAAYNTLLGCSTAAVTPKFTSNVTSGCPGMVVNYTDQSTSTGNITAWNWTFQGGNPSTSSLQNPSITYSASGTYSVKEVVTSTTGKDSVTVLAYINVIPTASLPLQEAFQSSTFPPTGWTMNLPVPTDSIWELCTTTGYNSSQCMYFPANCGSVSNISGEKVQMYTPDYSFASTTNAEMSFDVAYEPSSVPNYSDTLAIYYSTDCGSTWTSIYSKGGMTLCTTGSTTSAGTDVVNGCFVPPNTGAWRKDSINLSALNGDASVIFSFESRSGWGNIIYLDNINISTAAPNSVPVLSQISDVKVYPNPNSGSFSVSLSGSLSEKAQMEIFNAIGQQVESTPVTAGVNQVNVNAPSGIYYYRIITASGNKIGTEGKLMIQH